jgi:hypothetical protein
VFEFIDHAERRYTPPPPTPDQLREQLEERRRCLQSWDDRLAQLAAFTVTAEKAQQRHDQEITRLHAERVAIERSEQTGIWLDEMGNVREGVENEAAARHDQIRRELDQREKAHQAWIAEVRRPWVNRRNVSGFWSPRSVADLEIQTQHARWAHAHTANEIRELEWRLSRLEGRAS